MSSVIALTKFYVENVTQHITLLLSVVVLIYAGFIIVPATVYLVLFSQYRLFVLLYLLWIYLDRHKCERGSRKVNWLRNCNWWKYVRDYFPVRLEKVPSLELDPKKNYLFCSVPHGIYAHGHFVAAATNACGFSEMFPRHEVFPTGLPINFYLPIIREVFLAMGGCSVSANALNWILGAPEGGRIAILTVGGVQGALLTRKGENRLYLKNRKGFIKIALQNGTSLVPMYTFGEPDTYDQYYVPEGSLLWKAQALFKRITGVAFVFPYAVGPLPYRVPLSVLVGNAIDVKKVENPTQDEIDALHRKFTQELVTLFEKYKHCYLSNPQDKHIVIE